jgi:hypothetical protein
MTPNLLKEHKITKRPLNMSNDLQIYQQGPSKFIQSWIFGFKIYHLATLILNKLVLASELLDCSKGFLVPG